MAEYDDVERYRKLLEEWKPGPPAPKKTSYSASAAVSPMAVTSQKPAHLEKTSMEKPMFGPGTILRLNGRVLAIYKKAVPEKEYHLVLILGPHGSVKAQGIALDGYEIEELGAIAPKYFEKLQSEMQWQRDLVVFHCYSYEDTLKVPRVEGTEAPREPIRSAPVTPAPEAAPLAAEEPVEAQPAYSPVAQAPARPELNGNLRRGQRLQIKFGEKAWDAVYWGKDDQGQVIAHKTHEDWSLMHLDLKRFANTMQVEHEPDPSLVQEIEQALLKQ